jgi:hypothetical protein
VVSVPEKYEFVRLDHHPNYPELAKKKHVPNHQSAILVCSACLVINDEKRSVLVAIPAEAKLPPASSSSAPR